VLVLTALGLAGSLALRRPELVVLAVPFVALAAFGLRSSLTQVRAWLDLPVDRAVEGDILEVTLYERAGTPVPRLDVALPIPSGLELLEPSLPLRIGLGWEEDRELPVRIRCTRWGAYRLGRVDLRATDRPGMLAWEGNSGREQPLVVYPGAEPVRGLLAPAVTRPAIGEVVARVRGAGLEFADTRPYTTGDRLRSINWRASSRRNELIVNERHPERNAEVVLFVDSFAEAHDAQNGTLEEAVRVCASLASAHLARRDRVGMVAFGGILRWLEPGSRTAHRHRLIESLVRTEVLFSFAWKNARVIPARTLPPRALIIAVTPLLDERSVTALLDLRGRGCDVVVVEIPPDRFATAGDGPLDDLAHRLWLLSRDEIRGRFAAAGVPVARHGEGSPLAATIEGVRAFRRHARVPRR
jgi:uncharacterized protein (DUF58 family)